MKLFGSLSSRLLITAGLLISFFMLLTAGALNEAFKKSLLTAEQESLRTQVYLLLGVAEVDVSGLAMPVFISEPRFNQVQSGLYATVKTQNEIVWQSLSSQSLKTDFLNALPAVKKTGNEQFLLLDEYFLYNYQVIWEEGDLEQVFQVSVLHEQAGLWVALAQYQKTLLRWLGVATLALLILLLLLLRWGLLPLHYLAEDLKAIEQGKKFALTGDYPKELQAITANLNELLQHESEQRQRYSNTLGDLAHSLKTPLAVIQCELAQHENTIIEEQSLRMQDIVTHQLSRAVRRQSTVNASAILVAPCVQRLVVALQKVYVSKSVNVEQFLNVGTLLKVDERDLMEILGNVLDNAFKYTHKHIRIRVGKQQGYVFITIDDDGKGIPEDQLAHIFQRGQRIDTHEAGQGIGLAVVQDIVESYGGQVIGEKSEWAGLSLQITLPA